MGVIQFVYDSGIYTIVFPKINFDIYRILITQRSAVHAILSQIKCFVDDVQVWVIINRNLKFPFSTFRPL